MKRHTEIAEEDFIGIYCYAGSENSSIGQEIALGDYSSIGGRVVSRERSDRAKTSASRG